MPLPLRYLIEHAEIHICILRYIDGRLGETASILSVTPWWREPAGKNERRPDSNTDVPVWTSTATRPIWRGGHRTRRSPDRSGAGGRTTHHMLDRCTAAPLAPRGGKRCVLCQRLPSTTTWGNRSILSKRALIVHAILFDAVWRFRVSATGGARPAGTGGVRAVGPGSDPRATGSARRCPATRQTYIIDSRTYRPDPVAGGDRHSLRAYRPG